MNESREWARVGDVSITQADVNRLKRALGEQAASFEGEEGEKLLVEELIRQELLYLEAKKRQWDHDAAFQEVMAQVEKQQLQQYAMARLMGSVQVQPEEVEAYYEAHADRYTAEQKADPQFKAQIYQQLMLLRQQAAYVNTTRDLEKEFPVTRIERNEKGRA